MGIVKQPASLDLNWFAGPYAYAVPPGATHVLTNQYVQQLAFGNIDKLTSLNGRSCVAIPEGTKQVFCDQQGALTFSKSAIPALGQVGLTDAELRASAVAVRGAPLGVTVVQDFAASAPAADGTIGSAFTVPAGLWRVKVRAAVVGADPNPANYLHFVGPGFTWTLTLRPVLARPDEVELFISSDGTAAVSLVNLGNAWPAGCTILVDLLLCQLADA